MISRLFRFFKTDVWDLSLAELPRTRRVLVSVLRVFLLALNNFYRDQCALRATALTLYTLLSVVPVLALAFGIAKGFGFEKHFQAQILQQIPEQEAVLKQIIVFAQNLLETARGGVVAGVGVVVLLWSAINIFGQIEDALNRIWNVKKARSIGRKFSDYLSLMLVYPIAMFLSSSITVYLASQAAVLSEKTAILDMVGSLLLFFLRLLPYVILWSFFAFIYIFMPNRKVPFRSGVLAGILAGTLYQVVQWGYIALQVGVAKYHAIYGSFAALPLFLVWLQLSWIIVLFGAELSFGIHQYPGYPAELAGEKGLSPFSLKLTALQVVHTVIRAFQDREAPLSAPRLSERLGCPQVVLKPVIKTLVSTGILSEVRSDEDMQEPGYQPGCDTDLLTIGFVLEAMERQGSGRVPLFETPEVRRFQEALAGFSEAVRNSPQNRKLKEI
ncbi:MAG: YihY/virulence factor BrkB family protein [Deltaproteobacteria bacterium]|nr:YihY/virulence factor BrkB family protein [Deltaproteobacteria bacterium]